MDSSTGLPGISFHLVVLLFFQGDSHHDAARMPLTTPNLHSLGSLSPLWRAFPSNTHKRVLRLTVYSNLSCAPIPVALGIENFGWPE